MSRGRSKWQGHVAFFDRWERDRLVCLGGNQSDRVCFASKARVLATAGRNRREIFHKESEGEKRMLNFGWLISGGFAKGHGT
jgi:hypothetical protein